MAWNCPYAMRVKCVSCILCTKQMKSGVDYNQQQNALTAYCACQRFCTIERRVIQSDNAKQCFEYQSSK